MDKPYFDKDTGHWKVEIGGRIEEGNAYWCVCEYIRDNLYYGLGNGCHEHTFEGVLAEIVRYPSIENIEGDRDQYSAQELRIIDKLKEKIRKIYL